MLFHVPRGLFVGITVGIVGTWCVIFLRLDGASWSFAVGCAAGGAAFSALLAWTVSLTQTMRISQEGIVLYLVNKANWADIVAAERRPFLGLAYLRVRLRSGRRWAIPLYFRGTTRVADALVTFPPPGLAVRGCPGACGDSAVYQAV